jgi:hypothetical protein
MQKSVCHWGNADRIFSRRVIRIFDPNMTFARQCEERLLTFLIIWIGGVM